MTYNGFFPSGNPDDLEEREQDTMNERFEDANNWAYWAAQNNEWYWKPSSYMWKGQKTIDRLISSNLIESIDVTWTQGSRASDKPIIIKLFLRTWNGELPSMSRKDVVNIITNDHEGSCMEWRELPDELDEEIMAGTKRKYTRLTGMAFGKFKNRIGDDKYGLGGIATGFGGM
jgi:hypothetical protein